MKALFDPLRNVKNRFNASWQEYTMLRSADALFFSFPKSGRTWVRMILGKYYQLQYHLPENTNIIETEELSYLNAGIPRILFLHDDGAFWKTPDELAPSRQKYRRKKNILLVRHPADVLVSAYFEKTRRFTVHGSKRPDFEGSLSEFIYAERGSITTLICYYNYWIKAGQKLPEFLMLGYEQLHQSTKGEMMRLLKFLRPGHIVDEDNLEAAIRYADFDNMKNLEKANAFDYFRLKPGNVNDPESYKTRRGIPGGYVDYLDQEDIEYIRRKLDAELDKSYSFTI